MHHLIAEHRPGCRHRSATLSIFLCLVLAPAATAVTPGAGDVVRGLAAVEKLRDRDRHAAAGTAAFETRYGAASFERRLERHLKKAAVLEQRWRIAISGAELQAELDRMGRETRRPRKLRQLFAALGDDPDLIAEALARPALVDRKIRAAFRSDGEIHRFGQRSLDAWLAEQGPAPAAASVLRASGLTLPKILGAGSDEPDSWTLELPDGPPAKKGQSALWTGSELMVWGGSVPGPPASGLWTNAGFCYDPATDVWSPIRLDATTPEPRAFHSAVWTGSEMIVWGGETWSEESEPPYFVALDSGGRYDPVDDSWVPTPASGAPSARLEHAAVWTGSEMIVWGGLAPGPPVGDPPPEIPDYTPLDDGGRYDPAFGGWTATGGTPPSARGRAAAAWTGDALLVAGGFDGADWLDPAADGTAFSSYDPSADAWDTALPQPPAGGMMAAPFEAPQALWTGESLWLQQPASGRLLARWSGGAWSQPPAPPATPDRRYASLAWTGRRLLLWGGVSGMPGSEVLEGGGLIWDTATGAWSTIPADPPSSPAARFGHFGVWTGSEMLIWGGARSPDPSGDYSRPNDAVSSGGRFAPDWASPIDGGTWTSMPVPPTAAARGHSMVWTGAEMIVWGGQIADPVLDGVRYDPATDVWSSTSQTGAPLARADHTAVWTGAEMVVFGGRDAAGAVMSTGGRYDPAADAWTATGGVPPAARADHTAVWTGAEMIVWGGRDGAGAGLASGARYDPPTDAWTSASASTLAGRGQHAAVWTGTGMAVFGGLTGCPASCAPAADAAVYDPGTDAWSAAFSPTAGGERWGHSAVWTGTEMIVWGGTSTYDDTNPCRADGVSLDPEARTATLLATDGDPRCHHSAVWNGAEMIVWGGSDRINVELSGGVPPEAALSSGGRLDPGAGTWTATADDATTIPGTRQHTAVWTGEEMLVWGGRPEISGSLGVYYTDTVPTSTPELLIDGVPGSTVLLGGAAETVGFGTSLPVALFDDVEGAEQWTAGTGRAGTGATWHVAVAGSCAEGGDFFSPVSAWRFGEPGACHYQGDAGSFTLTSTAAFEIAASTLLELRYFLETDRVGNPAEQDAARIEASADGGMSWATVAVDLEHWAPDAPDPIPLDDTGETWRGLSIALAPYTGTGAGGVVRFVFERAGALNSEVGWVIDDVGLGEPAGDGRIPAGTLVASDGSVAEHLVGHHDRWDRPAFAWDLNDDGVADNPDPAVPDFEIDESDLATYGLDSPGSYPLALAVSDSKGGSDAQTVTLEVVDGEPPAVEVLSPNGGEAWPAGSTRVVSWSASDNVGLAGFDLAYHDDEAGTGPTPIACAETIDGDSRSCTWELPDATSTAMRLEIIAYDQRPAPGGPNAAADDSDAPFYLVQADSDEIRTLVVWHSARAEALYGSAERDALGAALAAYAAHVKVDGQLLDLANVPSLDPLYAAWDATAWATGTTADLDDNVARAGDLAAAIRLYLFEQISSAFTSLEYLVLAGGDSQIPFWRMAEDLPRYPESNYIGELQSFGLLDDASSPEAFCDETESPTMAAFCRDHYLSDVPYGASQATGVPGSSFTWWLPDVAVGRLVETPAQIQGLIDVFITQDGVTIVDRALTTGYDFLTDGGDAVNSLLAAELDLGATSLDRLSQAVALWSDDDLLARLFGIDPTEPSDLSFIDGHADHRAEGAAQAGDAGVLTTLEMQAAGAANRGGVVIGVGCHSGVAIEPDGGAADETDPAFLLDLPEILADRSFPVLVGNGGYGWGLSEGVGLGEQLVLLVAEEIVRAGQIAAGEALRLARQEYFLRQDRLDAFDHKVLHEAMLFGIPNYEVRVQLAGAGERTEGARADRVRRAGGPRVPGRPWLGDPAWRELALPAGRRLEKSALREAPAKGGGVSTLRILDFTFTAFERGQDTDGDPATSDWQEAYTQFDWCTDIAGESLLCTGAAGETQVGTFFALDGLASTEAGRPIQPMISFDSHLFGSELHGILIRGGEVLQPPAINPYDPERCRDTLGALHRCFDPVIGNPETEVDEPEGPAPTPYVNLDSPTPYVNLDSPTPNGFVENGASGGDPIRFDTLNAPMGAAIRRGVREIAPDERVEIFSQWLYRTREFTNYYSSSADWMPPAIGEFTADCLPELPGDDCFHTLVDHTAALDVPVTDAGEGIYKVFVTYTQDVDGAGDGAWLTVELAPAAGDRYAGTIEVERTAYYLVQAVDWAGNVGTVTVSGDDVDDAGMPIGSTFELPRLFPILIEDTPLFADGFESGDASAWSSTTR